MGNRIRIGSLESFYAITIVGISSSETDYRLSWILNQTFDLEIKHLRDICFPTKDNLITKKFSIFSSDPKKNTQYLLISNKSESGNLYSRYKNLDFYYIICEKETKSFNNFLLQDFKKIRSIQATFIIELDKYLKNIITEIIFSE